MDQQLINKLKDESKQKRKSALKLIQKQVDEDAQFLTKPYKDKIIESNSNTLSGNGFEPIVSIIQRLSDSSEINRELATNIILRTFQCEENWPINVNIYCQILPILANRLSQEKLIETCEEIRVNLIILLDILISNADDSERLLTAWMTEITNILSKTSLDDYHKIRQLSHLSIQNFISKIPSTIHLMAEQFLKPLLQCLSHQHSKIRVSAIETLEQVVMFGGKTCLPDKVASHFAQRLFDEHKNVRISVVKVAGVWLLEYVDRYSFWGLLMPLILSGFDDDDEEIQQTAIKTWQKIGQQYEKENEQEMENRLNFIKPRIQAPILQNEPRFCLGCREIASKELMHLLPGIRNDLQDWQSSTKLAASRLFKSLLILSEDNITQHFQSAYTALLLSIDKCEDDELGVETFKLLKNCAKLLGLFIFDPKIIIEQSELHLDKNSAIIILSCMVDARIDDEYTENLKIKITEIILSDTVSRRTVIDPNVQYSLLILSKFSNNFDVLLSIYAMTKFDNVKKFATNLLKSNFGSFDRAMIECDHILKTLDSDCWFKSSTDLVIFEALFSLILKSSNPTLTKFSYNFLIKQLNHSSEPENRVKILMILARLFSMIKICKIGDREIVENLFKPSLKWRAGKSSLAARSACCAALWSFVHLIDDFCYFEEILVPEIISLLDDDLETTRSLAVKLVDKMIMKSGSKLNLENFYHKIYIELIKRLDDVNDNIRIQSLQIWRNFFKILKTSDEFENYDGNGLYKAHWEYIFSSLLVHMDDTNEKFREKVFETLCEGKDVAASVLKEELIKAKEKQKYRDLCEKLDKLVV